MPLKAILFDMDGVLVDSFEVWYNLFNATLKHYGKKHMPKPMFRKKVWAHPTMEEMVYFAGVSIEEILDYYRSHFSEYEHHVKKEKGIDAVLKELKKQGFKLGVVTNTPAKLTKRILEMHNLLHYFDAMTCGDEVKKGKPDPEPVFTVCKKLNVKPEDCIFVGDNIIDAHAGKAAGCFVIGYRMKDDVDAVVGNLKDVLKIVGSKK